MRQKTLSAFYNEFSERILKINKLETRINIESTTPEQHTDLHIVGKMKVFGFTSPIGERCYRRTQQAYIQTKSNHTMTVMEGHLAKGWLDLCTYPHQNANAVVEKLPSKTAQNLSLTTGNKNLRSVMNAGSKTCSIGIHRSLFDADLRCALLNLSFPKSSKTIKVTDHLRINISRRIEVLLKEEMNEEEFHMETIDLVTTVLSSTMLTQEAINPSNRVKIVQRATDAIANIDPRLLTPKLIAENAFTSLRTLEYAFQEVLSLRPKQYIDFYRINLLRERIIASPHIAITQIGFEVGLPHLGNLSKNYKALYGETPSVTKNRLFNNNGN